MAIISLSTALSILVLNVHSCGDFPAEPPLCIEILVFKYLEPFLGFSPNPALFEHLDKDLVVKLLPDRSDRGGNRTYGEMSKARTARRMDSFDQYRQLKNGEYINDTF